MTITPEQIAQMREETTALSERSKSDDAFFAGSEIRQVCGRLLSTLDEIDRLKELASLKRKTTTATKEDDK